MFQVRLIGDPAPGRGSWLERYDAAVFQGIDELGQVRSQRSRQCLRLPSPRNWLTDGVAKNAPRAAFRNRHPQTRRFDARRQRARRLLRRRRAAIPIREQGVHHDRPVAESGERWRKRVVDQEPHSPAARGNARSRTASAAKSSASRTSPASRSGGRRLVRCAAARIASAIQARDETRARHLAGKAGDHVAPGTLNAFSSRPG